MVKMINRLTGSVMCVADHRVDEYLLAGHKLADQKETPKKRTRKKAEKVEQ